MKQAYLFIFEDEVGLKSAMQRLRLEPRVQFEAYTSHDLVAADESENNDGWNWVKLTALFGALSGLFLAVYGQWYANVVDMPLDIGGRPLNSWPAFIPIAWVFTVLCTAISVFSAFLFQTKLPMPHAPIFEVESYNLSKNFYSLLVSTKQNSLLPDDFVLTLGRSLNPISWERIP